MSDAKEGFVICSTDGCDKEASLMQCPTCVKFKLPPARFCTQDCFKKNWKTHKVVHDIVTKSANFVPPQYDYTGRLRPHYVTPMRLVPKEIPRPEYAVTGKPLSEMKNRGKNNIHIHTEEEIKGVREACQLGRKMLDLAHRMIRVGITTEEIDKAVHEATIKAGAYPSPLNYHNFPKSCCTSVNEVICHGIPDTRPLEDGDIVNVDITVYYKGYHGDLNETFCVGNVDEKYKKLIQSTYNSLELAMDEVKPGAMFRDFGKLISKYVKKSGFSVVRSYCGHGIGSLFHCAPNIPHYNNNKAVGECKPGMIFTIEPMINEGCWQDGTWPDDWTSVTKDGRRSAQFEHTIVVTETGFESLTARTVDSPPFRWIVDSEKKE